MSVLFASNTVLLLTQKNPAVQEDSGILVPGDKYAVCFQARIKTESKPSEAGSIRKGGAR